MIDRIKLRKQYKEETSEDWKMLYSTAQPTVEYTKWLEDRLVKNCSIPDVVGRSEQCCSPTDGFYLGTTCPHCKKPFRKDIK